MGKLKSLRLPSQDIPLPDGQSLTVRGLSLPDVQALVRGRFSEMTILFDQYAPVFESTGAEAMTDDLIQGVGHRLLDSAPDIAAHIIALGADDADEEGIAIAKRLPFPAQIEALEAIGRMTFDAGGGPKKVLETVVRVIRGLSDQVRSVRTSKAGSPAIDAR